MSVMCVKNPGCFLEALKNASEPSSAPSFALLINTGVCAFLSTEPLLPKPSSRGR